MLKSYFLFVFSLLLTLRVVPPTGTPTPESPYKFAYTADKQEVYRAINATVKDYQLSEWLAVEKSVRDNNREVEAALRDLNTQFQAKSEQLQQLAAAKNVAQLKANLEALKKAKAEIGRIAEDRLKPINYQGLYLVVCSGVSSRMRLEDIQKSVQEKIKPDAIATLNGAFIQSMSELQNNRLEYDYVKQRVAGTMEPLKMEYQDREFAKGFFAEIWTVRVSPLQAATGGGSGTNAATTPITQMSALDLYNNPGAAGQLQSLIPDEDFRNKLSRHIQDRLPEWRKEVDDYNEAMRKDEAAVIADLNNTIGEQDRKIAKAERELNENKGILEKILKEVGVNFDLNRLDACIQEAERKIISQIEELNRKKLEQKARELVFEKFTGIGAGVDPNQEMADNATAKIVNINKAHSMLTSFLQEVVMQNGRIDLITSFTQKDVYREVETYWVYPIPVSGKFDMGIVARFRMKQAGSSCPDRDRDGVCDSQDNCPDSYGTAACKGCPEPCNVPPPGMKYIPSGSFTMGDLFGEGGSDEKQHSKTVKGFYLSDHEVTFEEYDRFCTATGRQKPSDQGWGRGSRPVINVSWYDAVDYCNWRSEQEGLARCYSGSGDNIRCDFSAKGYRLPTEAEWEYAAREGGKKVRFGNGRDVLDPAEANFDASSIYKKNYSVAGEYRQQTLPVKSLRANALGLYDMTGNVWEWCWDWYGDYSSSNLYGPSSGSFRVLRGGSWFNVPQLCRAAFRSRNSPTFSYVNLGFRLCRTE